MKKYIVKDEYLHHIYLVNAESAKKACSKIFHEGINVEDSKLSDLKAFPLDDYIKDSEKKDMH